MIAFLAFILQFKPVASGAKAFSKGSRCAAVCLALPAVMALFLGSLECRAESSIEYQVKAGFIYNFTKFTEWPADAFDSPQAPIVICILGDDPFGKEFDDALRGQTSAGRRLTVKRVHSTDELPTCHVLFVSRSERQRLPQVLDKVKASSVLTVADFDGFARHGGLIQLTTVGGKVRFIINMNAEKRARVKLSAQLKNLALEIVRDGE